MIQTFKTEGTINATLTQINSRGNIRYDWVIVDEKNSCNSCLICTHYKYNHNNIKIHAGKFVHICMIALSIDPTDFIDITNELNLSALNVSCEHFSRRAIL